MVDSNSDRRNILLIDSNFNYFPSITTFIDLNKSDVVIFDSNEHTYNDVLIMIRNKNQNGYNSVCILQNNSNSQFYQFSIKEKKCLLSLVETDEPTLSSWNEYINFINSLKTEFTITNLDLLAFTLYNDLNWKYVIDTLETQLQLSIRSSINLNQDGYWFFETHEGINIKNNYLLNQQVIIPETLPISTTKKLILIDNRIKDIETIINSMNENTYCIVFNYFYDTYDTILSKIRFLSGSNRYILDNFFYETPELPVRMDSEGNHCTTCDEFSIDDLVLSPSTLQSEYLAHTNNPTTSLWEFYNDSTNISIQKPIFFQRAKKVETTEIVSSSSNIVPLKYRQRPFVKITDLDEIYQLAQTSGEVTNTLEFECIGIIQHTVQPYLGYKLVNNTGEPAVIQDIQTTDSNLLSWSSFVTFIQSLKTIYQITILDLMACALYSNPDWKYIIDKLEIQENITIRASNDNTGSSNYGGNWVLETNNVNLTNVYFTDNINNWQYVLATYIDNRFYGLRWNDSMYATRAYDARLKIAAGTSNFTIETWYYETAARYNCTIVDMGDYNYTFQIRNQNTSALGLSLHNPNMGWLYGESAVVPVAQWSHLAITRSGSTFTFYVNGVARQTFTNSTSLYSNNSTFAIGWQSPDTCQCNRMKTDCVLYDIRLWNVARTASEIQMYRNRIVPANSSGLVANYLCTDNSNTFNDRTSNALHTTIQNYSSSQWTNSLVPIPNIGFLINNGYSLTTYNNSALNALSNFDDITNTDFSNVNLSSVNFSNSNLTGCNFTGANLSGANMNGANLTNANLTNANLNGTYLIGANLTGATTTGSTIASAITTTTLTKSNSSAFYLTPPAGASTTYGPTWTQLGSTIYGANANDYLGFCVSISKDGNVIAVSSPGSDAAGTDRGFVKVFNWNGSSWVQRGGTFYGISNNDLITTSKLSADGNYVIFYYNDTAVSNKGFTGVYIYDSNKTVEDTNVNSASYGPIGWSRVGGFIYNESTSDKSWDKNTISISGNGQIIAIGCDLNDGTSGSASDNRGSVRVYRYDPNKLTEVTDQANANFGPVGWTRMGADIDGESAGDNFGAMIDLSTDGTVLAGAAVNSDVNGTDNGQIRVFKWNSGSSTWVQRGRTIYGQIISSGATSQKFANALSLSADGNIIACGNSTYATFRGITKTLEWNSFNNDYQMVGQQIEEYGTYQLSSHCVSLSSDGQILVVGAYDADRGLSENGTLRVYKLTTYATTLISTPPTNMTGYTHDNTTIYRMTITGNSSTGSVWGTNIYTADSNIARAAVHAGVVANGQTKEVYIKMERFQYKYFGSTRNGVTTNDFTDSSTTYLSYYFMDTPKLWVQLGNEIAGQSVNMWIGLTCAVSGDGTRFITGGWANSNGLYQVYSLSSTDNYSHTSSISSVAEVYGDIVIPKKAGFTTIASKQSSTITTSLLEITGTAPTFTSFPSVSKFTTDPQFTLTLPESNSTGAFTLTTGTVGTKVKYTRNALRFDGVNDTIILNSYPLLNTNQQTLEGWVFLTTYPCTILVINGNGGLNILADGRIDIWSRSSGIWSNFSSTSAVPLNTWTYVALVKNDNGYNKLYINNNIVYNAADTSSGNLNNCEGLSFGANAQASSSYSSFILSEFRIWSIARTEKQIRDNYNREVLSNSTGLQVYYKFNQGTADGNNSGLTTLTDSTSNGYNGSLSNFALSGTTSNYVTGVTILSKDKYNISNETSNIVTINPDVSVNALNFNGTNNYIDLVSNITELGQANFTIECWIKTTGSRMGIINCQDSDNTWEIGEKSFYLDSSGKPAFVGFGNNFILSTQAVDDNQWHHVAVVWSYSTTTGYIYIDGQDRTNKLNNLVYQANNNNAGRFIVGVPNNVESVNYFTGSMCELRIWSVARTASQIYQNFRRVLNGNETGLVCYNRLNQGTANGANSGLTTATNNMVSGGYAGTLYNFSLVSNTSNWTDGVTLRPNKDITITGAGVATITAIQEEAGIYDVGTTTATITVALQNFSSVLTFDGDNDAIDVGVPAWTYSTQFRTTMTVECWFKTADTNNQKIYTTLVGRNSNGGVSSTSQFSIYMLSTGEIGFGLTNNSNTGFYHTTVLSYKDTQWHHIAGTYDSATGTKIIYIDGIAVKTDTSASFGLLSNNSSTKLVFGSDDGAVSVAQTDRQFRGSLSDIRIWSTVRTSSQISSNYRQRLIGNESGLLGYWKLNQGYGTGWGSYTVALDSTNNRVNGTLSNFASPSSNWTLSSLAFLPRISDITLGSKNGLYSLADSSFTFIDPLSNSFGTFSYTINSAAATISNGSATTKTVYTTSGAITIPTLSLYDFPEIASLADWEINISFTVTSGAGTWRALLGDMYNEINNRGWGLWISSASPPKIHWSFIGSTFEPVQTTVSLNTPYILNVVKSSAGTITLTLQNVAGTYNNSLLISNLVASYNLDSNGNDSSGNSNTLTNVNTVTFNTSDYKRGSGAALFNGNNYFEISNNGNFSPDNLTVALWIKPQTNSSYQSIASCRASNPWRGWMLYIGPSASGSNLEIWSSSDGSNFTGQTSLFNSFGSLNTWVHLAFTLNKSTSALVVYINGTAFTTTTLGYTNNTTTNLRIGAGANEQTALFHVANGTMMDDFRIYNKVLTAAEIGTIVADSSFSSSFSIGANTIGKGPVTIGGWRSYGGEIFPGTISYVNVKVPTNQRLVTLVSNTGATPATITATQDSFMDFDTSTKTASLTIGNIAPTLSNFTIPTKNFGDAAFSLTAPTSDSPGSFTYTSSNTSVATISGSTVTIVAAGTSTITATQAASGSYTSGTITATLTVNTIAPTISNFTIPTKNFGDAAFSLIAPTSNSGGSFTYTSSNTSVATISGSTVTIVAAGTSTITATQAASGSYTSGTITATLTINQIAPTLSNFSIPTKNFGDAAFSLTAPTSNSGGSFTYTSSNTSVATISGSTVTIVAAGTSTITATQAASGSYTSGTITATLTVNTIAPTISNFTIPTKNFGDAAFSLTAPTSDSGGSFTYTSSNTSVATISGSTVTIVAAGTSTITATQAASGSYTSGTITATLTVNTIAPTISNFTIPTKYFGQPTFNLTAPTSNSGGSFTYTSSNTSVATISGSTVTLLSVGTSTITATQAATTNYTQGTITATLTVNSYENANLTGFDLSNNNLTGINLSNSTLTNVTSGSIIGNPTLPTNYILVNGYIIGPNVNLTNANLSSQNLTNANFTEVNLTGANLTSATLTGVISGSITGTPTLSASYSMINGYIIGPGVNLSSKNLSNMNLLTSDLTNVNLNSANIDNTNFSNTTLTGVTSGGITGTPILPTNYHIIKGYIVGANVNLTGATLTNINYSKLSYSAFDDFIPGPTAQSTNNDWQYFEVNTDRSSVVFLSNWQPEGTTNIPNYGQWDNNRDFSSFPLVQKVGDSGTIVSGYGPTFTGPALVMHPNNSDTFNAGLGYKNNTGGTINVNIDVALSLLFGTTNNLTGINYFIQRGLLNDARYSLYVSSSIPEKSTNTFTFNKKNIELQNGEFIYLIINRNGNFEWDFTRVVFNVTLNNFRNLSLTSVNFTNTNLSGTNLSNATLTNCNVNNTDLRTATLTGLTSSGLTGTPLLPSDYYLTNGVIITNPTLSNFTVAAKNFGDAAFNLTAPTSNSGGSFTYTSSNTSVASISGSTVTIVGAGSSTITATQAASGIYTSGTITGTFTVNPIAPTLSNFIITTKNFGDASFNLTAPTSNSSGAFTYTSSNTSVATISGSTVTIVGAGTSTITATQASTTNYTSGTITATFTVNQIAPTISNFTIPTKNFGDASFNLTAPTSNSGGSFTYTSSNTSVATISGSTVTIVGAGSSTITATQTSTTNYTSGTITAIFVVNPIAPTISNFTIPTKNFGDASFSLTAPTSNSGGLFSYTSSNTSVATISGSTVTIVGAGTSTITATQASTTNYTSGTITATLTVNQIAPTLSNFTVAAKNFGSSPFSLTAPTSNSGGSFTYTSSNTSVATISGSTVTVINAGSTTITATQASTTNYTSGTITTTFTVNQIAPGLSNFSMPTKNFGDSTFNIISNVHTSFYIRTGGSDWINSIINNDTSNTNIQYWNPDLQWYEMLYDNPNRIASQFRFFAAYVTKYYNITSGSASVITGGGNVGTYSFTYNGGTSYTGTFTGYNVGAQTWNYTIPVSVNVNTLVPTSNSSGSITYSSSNTSVATISGNTITIVGGGSSTITATQASTTNYTSDTITATLTVNPIAPTLSNFTIASKNYGSLPFNLTAPTSNSSGSFSYSSSDTSVATISGSTITTINAGSSTITATQAATANYTSSTITTTFTVNPIAPSLVISSPIATDFSFTQNSFTQVGQSLTVQSVNVDGYFVPSIVKISEDGTKIAVGGIGGNNKGIVRMYSLTSGTWTQIGGDILGTYGGGYAGMGFSKGAGNHAISISADGTILTTAETGISDPYTTRVINVFKYDASKTVAQNNSSLPNYGPVNWSRMTTFPVTATFNYSATAIISADGKTIAVSDGTLRMYRSDDNGVTWTQRGSSITDPANGTRQNNQGFSNTISISSNGLTVLIAGNPMYSGGVSAQFLSYDWDGTNWNSSLVREFSWGVTISNAISADASTCILSISNNSYNNGTIYRYSRVGLGSWTLVNSMSLSYWFYTVSISNNAKYLSLTRPQYNVSDFGDAEVYAWNGTTYDPIINNRNIKNRTLGNPSEFNASLTSSGSRFVVGGVGKVDVYDLNGTPNYIKIYNDPAFRIIATSSDSTGAITYTSSNTNVANITDTNLITIGNVGSSTINANISATTNYTSSTTSALLTVNQATPSLSNFTVAAKNYGDSSFSLTAPTSNSSGAFTYTSSNTSVATISGSTVTVVNAGSTTITATQASTSNYTSGTITATFIVNQIAPSISNFSVPTKNFGNASFSLTAPTSNSGGAFTYTSSNTAVATISGSTVTIVGGGTSTITATQSSTTNYTSGSITATFTVNPIAPTISNFSVPTKKFGDLSFSLTAPTTNSAGSFSYISSDTSVATISGSTATLTGPGTTTITATQAATANYTSGNITATFTITPNQGMALSGDGLVFALGKPNFNSQAGKVDIYSWNGTTWVQKGSTLNGSSGDSFGYSISLSNAGNIIVIGAYSGQSTRGYAKVYEFVSNDWQLKGSQINGDNTNDEFTRSISLSLDGTTFAGGSPASNYVKIFSWDGSAWTQKGSTLTGEASSRYSESIQLSSDGSLIAIGAPNFTTNTGYTKVFEFVSSSWTQKGSTLNGSATNEYFGYSVSLAGTDLVVGAYGGSTNTGYLKYYKWINSSWQQKGGTVTGSGTGNNFGYSVSVSSNNKIVTGAYGLSSNTGQVKAYNYNPFPSNPTNGQVFYNVDDNNLYIYDESGWVYNNFTSDGSIVNTSTSTLNGAVTVGSTLNVSGNTTLTGNVGIGQAPSATYKVDVLGSVRSSLFTTTSDYRIKEDISDISEDVDELKPIKYKNKLNNKLEYGFIAHEVQDVFPDMVYGNKDGEEYQSINYTELIPILVHEIQQLKEEIRNLKRQ